VAAEEDEGRPSGVGGKLRAIAKKIGERLKKIGKAVVGGVKKAAGAIKRGAKAVGRAIKRGAKAVGRAIKKGAAWVAKRSGKLGKAIKRGYQKLKKKVDEWKKKYKDWREKRKKKKEDDKQKRLDKAVSELTPKLQALVEKGVGKLRLKAQLAFWRVRYRLTSLEVVGGKSATVRAKVNPQADLIRNVILTTGDLLHQQVDKLWPIVLEHPRVKAAIQQMRAQRSASMEDKSAEQGKKGQQITGPYNRTEVNDPGVPGAASLDVMSGSQMADGKPRPPHTIETHNFLVDQHGKPLTSTSERQESGGPGGILVTGGGRYNERAGELAALSSDQSRTLGEGILAIQSGKPLPPGVDPKQVAEFARLNQVEGGRDKGAFVTLQMMAQLMAQGKITAAEGITGHQMSDIGAMDITRRAEEQRQREARANQARDRGEDPARRTSSRRGAVHASGMRATRPSRSRGRRRQAASGRRRSGRSCSGWRPGCSSTRTSSRARSASPGS
jgi:hypothetical protein